MLVGYQDLLEMVVQAFLRNGFSEDEARPVAEEILFAEARGKQSHGLNMIQTMIKRHRKPHKKMRVLSEDTTSCLIDGGGTVGPVVARLAMNKAIEKAANAGIAIAGVRNPSPFLTAGYNVWRAAAVHEMIGIDMSVAKSKVAPFGTAKPILGTNPIGFAFPADPYPVVIDMAVTKIPGVEVKLAQKEGRKLPDNVAFGPDGCQTTDPKDAQEGALIPFGGYKGTALGILVELLSGALVEAKCGLRASDMRAMVFIAIQGDIFAPLQTVKRLAAQLREDVANSPPLGREKARLPGDKAQELYQRALKEGVDVPESVYHGICTLGEKN